MPFEWTVEYSGLLIAAFSAAGGLLFNAVSTRANTHALQVQNLIALAAAHREIWRIPLENRELRRCLQSTVLGDLTPTFEETVFVRFVVHQLYASFRARSYGMYSYEAGLAADIKQFFSKPIPRAIWLDLRRFQEKAFIAFIDGAASIRFEQKLL